MRSSSVLDGKYVLLLAGAVAISFTVTFPRFLPGIPMSIDTTSHLYRVLFLNEWLKQGVLPFWSPDWYGGSPAVLLYSPLGYYITVGLSLTGLDPLLSYKIIDAVFYWVAPVAVYFLARELGFAHGESALGALLFSVVPEVIENYLFYDRFPTVISIPILCAFLTLFHRALLNRNYRISLLGSTLAMSALLLTHHLSALIAGILALLFVFFVIGKEGLRRPLVTMVVVAVGTIGLTAFWLVPFVTSVTLFSGNEFYNRNVIFPFLRFSYFGRDVVSYLLGIAQFILAAVGMQIVLTNVLGKKLRMSAALFFVILFAGMIIFEQGEALNIPTLVATGEILVVASFTCFLGQLLIFRDARKILRGRNGVLLAAIWFLLFLWIGLGYYALPILWLPYLADIWIRTMDVYRIWLYLALPTCALAARALVRSAMNLQARKRALIVLLIALTIAPIATSAVLKANYVFNSRVNQVLPYTASNAEIPKEILSYFQNDKTQGRILGIDVPLWIYVLPNYADKPIIDGWYPQSKLVTQLVKINDYRLDDLETTSDERRLEIWRSLIANSSQLGIVWVIIGTEEVVNEMMPALTQAEFTEQLRAPYRMVTQQLTDPFQIAVPSQTGGLFIFKTSKIPSYADAPEGFIQDVARPNPDMIVLRTSASSQDTMITIKEAYFPTWIAEADGTMIPVTREQSTGFILLNIPPDTHELAVYQKPQSSVWSIASGLSLAICLALIALTVLRKRRRG